MFGGSQRRQNSANSALNRSSGSGGAGGGGGYGITSLNNGNGGQRRSASVNSRPNYLSHTNSSASHAKGGLKSLGTNRPSSSLAGKPPRAAGGGGRADQNGNADFHNSHGDSGNNNAFGENYSANKRDDGSSPLTTANLDKLGGGGQDSRPQSAAAAGGNFNFNNTFNTSSGAHSVARTVYRPSAILIDKIVHGQHPPLAPIDPLNGTSPANSPARSVHSALGSGGIYNSVGRLGPIGGGRPGSSAMRTLGSDGQQHGGFRPSSTAYGSADAVDYFNTTNASNTSAMSLMPPSVGAKDVLRFKESLKGQSPSAIAVAESRRQLAEDQERERQSKLEYREQWRRAVEDQLKTKEQRRLEEKERGKQERTVIEDRFLEEKSTIAARKRQMAAEIQRQKYEDEVRDAQKAQEAVERARQERAQMDATVHQMHVEKKEQLIAKVKTQQEILAHATALQQQRQEEKMRQEAERKQRERELANAAKEAEVREALQVRQEQKQRQREVLEASRALSAIKNLNDSKAQMEYESALEEQKRKVEDRDAREQREQLEAKARLAHHLKQQMQERQESRLAERKRTIEQQRQAADAERRRAEEELAAEKQLKILRQQQLQRELEGQMVNNLNKTLVELIHD